MKRGFTTGCLTVCEPDGINPNNGHVEFEVGLESGMSELDDVLREVGCQRAFPSEPPIVDCEGEGEEAMRFYTALIVPEDAKLPDPEELEDAVKAYFVRAMLNSMSDARRKRLILSLAKSP